MMRESQSAVNSSSGTGTRLSEPKSWLSHLLTEPVSR